MTNFLSLDFRCMSDKVFTALFEMVPIITITKLQSQHFNTETVTALVKLATIGHLDPINKS